MLKWLKRLMVRMGWARPDEGEPVGYEQMSYDELADLYAARGWPPPSKRGYHKLM